MEKKRITPEVWKSFFKKEKPQTSQTPSSCSTGSDGCDGCSCSGGDNGVLDKPMDRRQALSAIVGGATVAVAAVQTAASPLADKEKKELSNLKFEDYFKKNYRLMTKDEKKKTVERLERMAELEHGKTVSISSKEPLKGVLFGYAFNISKCQGYMDCIKACLEENNQDQKSNMQYIKIWEMKNGSMEFEHANGNFYHEVPQENRFYLGTQCFHCDNPPCTKVCPVGATWKEDDGIVVVDYDWCIGCRYCEAACPYFGRRFNWNEPEVPAADVNPNQHYLGNRSRGKGVMEKCTFCVQRTRDGRNPACVEACPTGSRTFGNLLDPDSEIRYIIENKKVFRLKEDLGTEPKFWYYMD